MNQPAKKLATVDDLLAMPDHLRIELIDGVIVEKASPSFEHLKRSSTSTQMHSWRLGMSILASNYREACVTSVRFDDASIVVDLDDGRTISAPLAWYPKLLKATQDQLSKWQISGGGLGIHWPDIDEDLSAEGLLRGAPAPKRS